MRYELHKLRNYLIKVSSTLSAFSVPAHIVLVFATVVGFFFQYFPNMGIFAFPFVIVTIFSASAYLALIGYSVILLIVELQKGLERWWENNTPPYRANEQNKLPVLDRTKARSLEKIQTWFNIWAWIWLITTISGVYIALKQPPLVEKVFNSLFVEVLVLSLQLILQIPSGIFTPLYDLNWTSYDASVVFLMIFIPSIPLMFVIGNIIGYFERDFEYHLSQCIPPDADSNILNELRLIWTVWTVLMLITFSWGIYRNVL